MESNCIMCGLPQRSPRHQVGPEFEYIDVWTGQRTSNPENAMSVKGKRVKFSKAISQAEKEYLEPDFDFE